MTMIEIMCKLLTLKDYSEIKIINLKNKFYFVQYLLTKIYAYLQNNIFSNKTVS